jgi:hypothetical protein
MAALCLAVAGAAGGGAPVDFDDQALPAALQAIRPSGLRAHIRFLASDSLEGRGTATRGHRLAAEYVATQLEALGLEPGMGEAGFLQPVPLRRATVVAPESFFRVTLSRKSPRLRAGRDYVILPSFVAPETRVRASLVFVGYGITAPELACDDYAELPVAGRVAVALEGAPSRFPPDLRAHHGALKEKLADVAAKGAVGLVVLSSPRKPRSAWDSTVEMLRAGGMRWLDPGGAPDASPPAIRLQAVLGPDATQALLGGGRAARQALQAAEAGRPAAVSLDGRVEARTVSRFEDVESPNVVARLPGSDPVLGEECLVYSAHLDHLGIGKPVDGDAIYNGAYDNASGSAGLLEIARAFASLKSRPARSVLFVAVTAEEAGLLGSDYFVHYPPVPREHLVADVNLDGLMMLYEPLDVVAYGAEHSTLAPLARAAAERLGFRLSPDPWPEQALFVRSDHYSFVRQGIPAVFLMAGMASGSGSSGERVFRGWLGSLYHSPKDDTEQKMDFEVGARLARVGFLVGWAVATRPERPRFNPGDPFRPGPEENRRPAPPP